MKSACEDLHPFADGQLDAAEHERFADHLVGCDACWRELESTLVIGALADQVRAEQALAKPAVVAPTSGPAVRPVRWWQRRGPRNGLGWIAVLGAFAATAVVIATITRPPTPTLLAELGARAYRSTEARLAAGGFEAYRPLSGERGPARLAEQIAIDHLTTFRQQALGDLEARREHHELGVVYLLGRQYPRAERALAAAPESPAVWNDRAALAYLRGRPAEALALAGRVLRATPGHGPALWNQALALEALGRFAEAARAFEACAARGEAGWSAEARERARVLAARARESEVTGGRPR